MKILIINTLYPPNVIGGAELSVKFLAEALVSSGNEVVVLSANEKPGTLVKTVNGVKVYYVGLKNLYWPFRDKQTFPLLKLLWHLIDSYNPLMAMEVKKILKLEKPDLVHTNNIFGFSVAVWRVIKASGLPIIHTLRDYYLLCPKNSMFSKGKNCKDQCPVCLIYSIIRKVNTKLIDVVVGNSSFILKRHTSFGLFSNATKEVIFNAYEKKSPLSVINKENKLRLGYIGRLHPTKGIEVILEAVNNLTKKDFILYIAGRGSEEYERHLRNCSGSNIHYLGFTSQENFFSRIDLLIVPSLWHDPLPRTVFEAYAHGIPVIGSNRGGIPELVVEGKTGFLFDPGQPETLREVIKNFFENPDLVNKMQKDCLKKAADFIPEQIVKQYMLAYQKLAD